MIDGEDVLREFARRCALDVIDLWDAPEIVREYLETGDENIRKDAARAAARATRAAWTAARGAARDDKMDKYNGWLEEMIIEELASPNPKLRPT